MILNYWERIERLCDTQEGNKPNLGVETKSDWRDSMQWNAVEFSKSGKRQTGDDS